ncbi:hypothetical protein [Piscinibacter sp. XHJ-5]|uniref:hypothetical protein n=1 Tax=Piscinibacter sp. XHJ-5 TaxID=3037797 RepID=UPI002452D02A|nr:hypothetical protein [Piscinibacter sp. XHJ-5]
MNLASNLHLPSRTNPSLKLWGRGLLAAISLVSAQHAAMAQDNVGSGLQTYRCVVLGDRDACPTPVAQSPVRLEERIEPGPIAKYYVYQGMDRDAAIEKARASGELPTRLLVRVKTVELTDKEKYDRFIAGGARPKTVEEVVVASASQISVE